MTIDRQFIGMANDIGRPHREPKPPTGHRVSLGPTVEQDHAIAFTGLAWGQMVLAGDSVLIMEAEPAAYLSIACNEALKAADVNLIDIRVFGATGRLIMAGTEAQIDYAAEAATKALDDVNRGL